MIREFQIQDITKLTQIYNYYIENTTITFELDPLTETEFLERIQRIQKNFPFYVLEEDNEIIGYAYLDYFNPRPAYNTTLDVSIYLDHKAKGKGYGSTLMQTLIDYANTHSIYKLISLITDDNIASKRIHEKFGFIQNACFQDVGFKFNKWLDVSFYVYTNPTFDKNNYHQ